MRPGSVFSKEQENLIVAAITEAERRTSAELRVHADHFCKGSPVLKAENLFLHMKMHETELRNGVLIYVAMEDHKFAVVGDQGIHSKVGEKFWQEVTDLMKSYFEKGEIISGICEGIGLVGEQLAGFYPWNEDDQNELPNDINYS